MKHNVSSNDDHEVALKEMNKSQELIKQLQALLKPYIPANYALMANDLFKQTLRCSNLAISILQARGSESGCESSDHGSMDGSESGGHEKKRKCSESDYTNDGRKIRRSQEHSWSITTTVPHEDGHQWRKYGQKIITGAKHPRSYFRCTYNKEQRCQATKTVQQQNTDCDPPKYTVIYNKEHICKAIENNYSPLVLECTPTTTATMTNADDEGFDMLDEYLSSANTTTPTSVLSGNGSFSPSGNNHNDLGFDQELICELGDEHNEHWDLPWNSMDTFDLFHDETNILGPMAFNLAP